MCSSLYLWKIRSRGERRHRPSFTPATASLTVQAVPSRWLSFPYISKPAELMLHVQSHILLFTRWAFLVTQRIQEYIFFKFLNKVHVQNTEIDQEKSKRNTCSPGCHPPQRRPLPAVGPPPPTPGSVGLSAGLPVNVLSFLFPSLRPSGMGPFGVSFSSSDLGAVLRSRRGLAEQ